MAPRAKAAKQSAGAKEKEKENAGEGGGGDEELPPVKTKTVKVLTLDSLKRSHDLFVGNHGMPLPLNDDGERAKISCKIRSEYAVLKDMPPPAPAAAAPAAAGGSEGGIAPPGKKKKEKDVAPSAITELLETMPESAEDLEQKKEKMQLSVYKAPLPDLKGSGGGPGRGDNFSAQIMKRIPSKWPKPVWHAPWKLYRVISGHLGWVRSVAIEPGNEWFVTGSADRTVKIWDLASGQLKLTLTGHIEQVTGLAVSPRHPYMFSCGLDKTVKCWDLEYNKVIRHYHGHLSGVYALSIHPTLDVLFTGGRDSTCRVWDMRTKQQVHCLSGHDNTVCSIITQPTDPQVVTGSHDSTIKTWDLAAGKCSSTLTYHKKSVRAMVMHPTEYAFASASADNIKKFKLPEGTLLHNMLAQQKAIVNCMAVNEDGVMATGGDNGSMWFWDWKSGHNFQQHQTQVQPGSLESESGLFATEFDKTGTRLITCEADKTIKMYKEDPDATEETHPLNFRPPSQMKRW